MKIPEFAMPWLFLLLIPALGAVWILFRKIQPSILFPNLRAVKAEAARIPFKRLIPCLLIVISLILIVISLTRPREGLEQIKRRSDGVDIIIALDVSGSMRAIDIPENVKTNDQLNRGMASGEISARLNIAKQEISTFIKKRPADRIGLIIFSEQPYLACPPTLDHGRLLTALADFRPGMIGDKTGIAGPIASGIRRLKDSDSKRKIIVLFTDGANNVQAQVSPRQAAKLAETFGITVYTVGIGAKHSIIPQETSIGTQYIPVQSDFDEQLLREIASVTNGKYYHAEDVPSMEAAMKAIDSLEKTTFEQQVLINWRELSIPLIAAALGCLLLAFLLENTVFLKAP